MNVSKGGLTYPAGGRFGLLSLFLTGGLLREKRRRSMCGVKAGKKNVIHDIFLPKILVTPASMPEKEL